MFLLHLHSFAAPWGHCSSLNAETGAAVEWEFLQRQYLTSPNAGWQWDVSKQLLVKQSWGIYKVIVSLNNVLSSDSPLSLLFRFSDIQCSLSFEM